MRRAVDQVICLNSFEGVITQAVDQAIGLDCFVR